MNEIWWALKIGKWIIKKSEDEKQDIFTSHKLQAKKKF